MIRTVASAVLWVVALVAIAVTLPVAWVSVNIADEDGYVDFTAPFATDGELRSALSVGVSDSLVEATNLPVGQDLLRGAVDRAFTALAEDPGFPGAWRESQRASHRATFADGDQQRVVVDLAPVIALVAERASGELPLSIPTPETATVPVTRDAQPTMIETVQSAPAQAALGGAVAVAATLGALLFARRRGTALGLWGLGVVAVSVGLMVATNRGVPDLLASRPADSALATTMRDLLVARATASFDEWLLVTVAVGGVATLLGFGWRIVRR